MDGLHPKDWASLYMSVVLCSALAYVIKLKIHRKQYTFTPYGVRCPSLLLTCCCVAKQPAGYVICKATKPHYIGTWPLLHIVHIHIYGYRALGVHKEWVIAVTGNIKCIHTLLCLLLLCSFIVLRCSQRKLRHVSWAMSNYWPKAQGFSWTCVSAEMFQSKWKKKNWQLHWQLYIWFSPETKQTWLLLWSPLVSNLTRMSDSIVTL